MSDYHPVAGLAAMLPPLLAQLSALREHDPVIGLIGVLGAGLLLIAAVRTRDAPLRRAAILLVPFPLVYLLLMSRFAETFWRNLVLILPFLCLAAGYGVSRAGAWVASRLPARAPAALRSPLLPALVAGLLLTAEPGREMINLDRYMAAPDSRNLAFAWLQSELQAGRRAAVELHPWQACAPPPAPCPAPDLYAPAAQLTHQSPAWYAQRGYDYVVLLGREQAIIDSPGAAGPRPPAELAPYLALPEVQHFAGDHEGGKGPPVLVLRVGPGLDAMRGVTRSGAAFGEVAQLWGYAYAPLPTAGAPYDPADPAAPAADGVYQPGAAVGLRLYWRAVYTGPAQPPGAWTVAVHVSGADGRPVAQTDVQPISNGRLRPTADWYANEFLAGAYDVPLPPDLPVGTYQLTVAMWDPATQHSLPVILGGGHTPQPDLVLGSITVGP